jgi:cobalt transporter subunit CbtB
VSAFLAAPTITPNMLIINSGDVALIKEVDSVTIRPRGTARDADIFGIFGGVDRDVDVTRRLVADEPYSARRMTPVLLASNALVLSSTAPTLPGSPNKQEKNVQRSHGDSVIPAPIALSNWAGVIFEGLLAMSLGVFMGRVLGFPHSSVVHNAAHRARHSNALPSH